MSNNSNLHTSKRNKNDDDFDIVAIANTNRKGNKYDILTPYVNGKQKFKRLLIRRRKIND